MARYFVDTNILLAHLDWVEVQDKIYLSSTTLKELEGIKTSGHKSDDTRFNARRAVRWLQGNPDKYEVPIFDEKIIQEELAGVGLADTPDGRIVVDAYLCDLDGDIVFVTNDLLCSLFAKNIFKLKVMGIEEDNGESIYKGYKTIRGMSSEINTAMQSIILSNYEDWYTNEYLIIENTEDGSCKEMRFDGAQFVSLKLPSSKYIKAKNSLQRCALDILNNPDITIAAVLGGYGSGKTFVSMQMALHAVREKGWASKILGVREVTGEGKEIGWLPGEFENKVGRFFDPLVQSLSGGEFELERLQQQGILDTNVPYFMKGTTYNETVIICDEAEDLTESQIKLIGTRLGENSRIYFAGDYKQSLVSKTINNPLVKMCNEFKGNPKFGCIYLGEDVRSSTSKMFADLFNKD